MTKTSRRSSRRLSQGKCGPRRRASLAESHGFLYVPAGGSLWIYLPFYKDVSLWEPSPLETSADRPHFKRGAQRVVLERAGGISLKLSKEQFARLWSHDGPEIGVEDSTGKTLGHLDYSVRYLEKSSEVYINRIPPGRYRILLKRFGPYQPLTLPDIEVRALERTHLDNLRLEEGATLIVESAEMMADFKAHNINCVIDGARFVRNDAKEVREAILGSFTKTGLHFQGIPPSSGTLEIDMLKTYYPFHATRADLLRRLGRNAEAASAYERAAALAQTEAERDFLRLHGRHAH